MKYFNFISRLYKKVVWFNTEKKASNNTEVGKGSKVSGKIDIRNEHAQIKIGLDCTIAGSIVLNTAKSRVLIGDNVSIGGGTIIESAHSVIIENDVLTAYQVLMQDSNNHSTKLSERRNDNKNWNRNHKHDWNKVKSQPVLMSNGCWLGARSIILKGVTLSEGCIVGAGSVVTKSFPPFSVIGGNPAKLIRILGEDER